MIGNKIGYDNRYRTEKEAITIGDPYKDAMNITPASQLITLIILDIIIIAFTVFLIITLAEGYSTSYRAEGVNTMKRAIQISILLIIAGIIVTTLFIWMSIRDFTHYEIKGEVQLDLKFRQSDTFRIHPLVSFGIIILTIAVITIPYIRYTYTGHFPKFAVMVMILGLAGVLGNIFARKHYVLTDEGIGYFFLGIRPMVLFREWSKFKHFSVAGTNIHLEPEKGPLLTELIFPRRIPAFERIEDARFILQHYLPEG